MRIGKILSFIGMIAFGAYLFYGLFTGTFISEGSILISLIWGRISLADVYIMFFLFGFWIIYREKSAWRSAIWFIALMIFGAFTACLYTFITFQVSRGDWKKFWFGRKVGDLNAK
jgi:hypothetical protein